MQQRDHDKEPPPRSPARSPRLACGTGEHAPLQIDPITHHVVRLVRELQGPIADLGKNLHALDAIDGVDLGVIRESLRMVEGLSRDLCMSLLEMSREPAIVSNALCGTSVLVVDVDAEQVQTLRDTLQEHGVTVATATSAPECLVRLAAERPDAVVLDLSLGSAFASTLALALPDIPIIATTTAAEHAAAAEALSRANAYIVGKPYRCGELVVLLEQILIAPRGSR